MVPFLADFSAVLCHPRKDTHRLMGSPGIGVPMDGLLEVFQHRGRRHIFPTIEFRVGSAPYSHRCS